MIITDINKNVLKSFKPLQRLKEDLYVSAKNNRLTTVTEKVMIVYHNEKEIKFEGTYRIARNKLVPVELDLDTDKTVNLDDFKLLKEFSFNMDVFQRYCYENKILVDFYRLFSVLEKIEKLFDRFKFYVDEKTNRSLIHLENENESILIFNKLL